MIALGCFLQVFKYSTHIVVERAQRNICPTYWEIEKKLLITPYVPNFPDQVRQYQAWETPLKPLAERRLLLYAKTRCQPFKIRDDGGIINIGKKMRRDFAVAMESRGADVQVHPTRNDGLFLPLAALSSLVLLPSPPWHYACILARCCPMHQPTKRY